MNGRKLNQTRHSTGKYNDFNTYLFYCELFGLYKIGKAVDVEKRVKSTDNPFMEIVDYCPDNIEHSLHDKYKHKRVAGEWFDLDEKEKFDILIRFNGIKRFKK